MTLLACGVTTRQAAVQLATARMYPCHETSGVLQLACVSCFFIQFLLVAWLFKLVCKLKDAEILFILDSREIACLSEDASSMVLNCVYHITTSIELCVSKAKGLVEGHKCDSLILQLFCFLNT